MPERDIRKALKKRVEAYGGEIRAVTWFGRRNAPDVICLFSMDSLYARLVQMSFTLLHPWVECKALDGVLTFAQQREHVRMRSAGCVVKVISTIEQLDDWLPPRA